MGENKINWWKIAVIAIAAALLFCFGFYIGRKREPEVIVKTEIKYVELPPIHDSIPYPVPYKVVEPADTANVILACIKSGKYVELFPERERTDTIYVSKEDTSAVIKDWAAKRLYAETLFEADTVGRCSINATVQYNRLEHLDYTFIPVQKQTEVTTKTARKFLPYIGAGLNTSGSFITQGGMFFSQDAGFGVQYGYDTRTKTNSVGALFLWMF